MNENFKAEIRITLEDAVSLNIGEQMKILGFLPPKPGFGQIWQTARGHIIAFYAIDLHENLVYKILNQNEETGPLSSIIETLFTFLPNATDILNLMPDWANEGPDNEGNFKCYLIDSPELKFEDRSRHEACARAWLFVHQPKG